jgi:hypothetical protein
MENHLLMGKSTISMVIYQRIPDVASLPGLDIPILQFS